MKILFLSHYFTPEVNAPATRTFEHCRRWVELGHDVTVVSCVPHHPMGKAYQGYSNKLFYKESIAGIKVIRVKTYITANEGFLKRTLNYVLYMLAAIICSLFTGKADVVVSTTPQFFNGLAGYFVSRIKRAPWVLEIRDLWPESIVAVGAVKNNFVIAVLEWIERFVYKKSDRIISVTDSFVSHIKNVSGRDDGIHVIRNGVDLNMFTPIPKNEAFSKKYGLLDKFVVSYVGTHGMAHGLDTILDAAKLLSERKDIAILMVGDGSERSRLDDKIKNERISNIVMLGQQPKEMMPKIWSVSDVSLVVLRRLDLFKSVIPSKIFESMAMEKPIILGVEGEVEKIIDSAGSGISIPPEDASALAQAIIRLADDHNLYRECSNNGRVCVERDFDRLVLADNIAVMLAELIRCEGYVEA
ncbi:D-inositol-3-phosphate glycosyltransferase [Sinobacterium norvegicum]|uniref:D-inositol-3-phosphate glycosyltransferase n=1 Tax=Sinobacterium norvegicum TaxID=1641715 RepID=A0ABM9AJA9_9GAMM|nr:glycosyltransferase family 4 protein [Sinobacterium norvegicum]CAH0993316.1 D-inositol-3-phosphate glycosyltransferase [Sinobacterium norvegicum]